MREKLIRIVKYNKFIYWVYSFLGKLGIEILKLFVKKNDNVIIFVSFGGKKYDDSPKAIYEAIIEDSRYDDCNLVWAFRNPEFYDIPRGEKVKIDTLNYYIKLLSAKIWITNSSVNRGLNFRVKHVLYINTWHGVPIKRLGNDTVKDNRAFGLKKDYTDYYYVSSNYDYTIMKSAFQIPEEKFLKFGLPRNDELYRRNSRTEQDALKAKIGVEPSKKVILYAPTFREFNTDADSNIVLIPPINLKKWQDALGDDYILLFRAHYEVSKLMEIEETNFVMNMTDYPNLNELMLAADILISDYSSTFFDFSILNRPMLCFPYDYDEYVKKRGVYIDIREELQSNLQTEDDVLNEIMNLDVEKRKEIATSFFNKYMPIKGNSCKLTLDLVYNKLS